MVTILSSCPRNRQQLKEVDFNFRSQEAGFLSAVAIDCFVYHDKTKSYTTERRTRLIKEGRAHIDRLHGSGRVKDAVEGSRQNPILKAIRAQAAETFATRGWMIAVEKDQVPPSPEGVLDQRG